MRANERVAQLKRPDFNKSKISVSDLFFLLPVFVGPTELLLHDVENPGHGLLGRIGIEKGETRSSGENVDARLRVLGLACVADLSFQVGEFFVQSENMQLVSSFICFCVYL